MNLIVKIKRCGRITLILLFHLLVTFIITLECREIGFLIPLLQSASEKGIRPPKDPVLPSIKWREFPSLSSYYTVFIKAPKIVNVENAKKK